GQWRENKAFPEKKEGLRKNFHVSRYYCDAVRLPHFVRQVGPIGPGFDSRLRRGKEVGHRARLVMT
ncbi:MAG: hypothetical protein IKO93_12410, partial [Lentisphaeria bacterium]|nr:hypothetical protein [Lentisphaeria bacterium]